MDVQRQGSSSGAAGAPATGDTNGTSDAVHMPTSPLILASSFVTSRLPTWAGGVLGGAGAAAGAAEARLEQEQRRLRALQEQVEKDERGPPRAKGPTKASARSSAKASAQALAQASAQASAKKAALAAKKMMCCLCKKKGSNIAERWKDDWSKERLVMLQCSKCSLTVHNHCYGLLRGGGDPDCAAESKSGNSSTRAGSSQTLLVNTSWVCIGCSKGKALASIIDQTGHHSRRSRRANKSRLQTVDGHQVLNSNMYDLETGEPSVYNREMRAAEEERKLKARQEAVDRDNELSERGLTKAARLREDEDQAKAAALAMQGEAMVQITNTSSHNVGVMLKVIEEAIPQLCKAQGALRNTKAGSGAGASSSSSSSSGRSEGVSFAELCLWIGVHAADRFVEGSLVPFLVQAALQKGLETGTLRMSMWRFRGPTVSPVCLRARDWASTEALLVVTPQLQPEGDDKQERLLDEQFVRGALSLFRGRGAGDAHASKDYGVRELNTMVRALGCESSGPSKEDKEDENNAKKTRLIRALDALTMVGVVDRFPMVAMNSSLKESSRRVGFSVRHLFNLRSKGEPVEDMKQFATRPPPPEAPPELMPDGGWADASANVKRSELQLARQANNSAMLADAKRQADLRLTFLSRHADWLRPFVAPAEAKLLDEHAKKHNLKSACVIVEGSATEEEEHDVQAGTESGAKPWLNPIHSIPDSPSFIRSGEMRPHQLEGLSWMNYMDKQGCPMILGDEMGLGKTLQTIAFLAHLKLERGIKGPHLIVCPLSVVTAWASEFARWCPTLKVARLHSSDVKERERLKKEVIQKIYDFDAVITTYDMMKGDLRHTLGQSIVWRYLVLDEGHKIKNEASDISQVMNKVRTQSKLLLTGTPLQNNLRELWALLAFMIPDMFKVSEPFDDAFNLSQTAEVMVKDDILHKAHYVLRPFMLRRLKKEVEFSLPAKEVIDVRVPLTKAQVFWYKQLLSKDRDLLAKVDGAGDQSSGSGGAEAGGAEDHLTTADEEESRAGNGGAAGGGGGGGGKRGRGRPRLTAKEEEEEGGENDGSMSGVNTGNAAGSDWKRLQSLLTQLRKCCNHPFLFRGVDPTPGETHENVVTSAGKLALLDRLLPKLKERGHRVVLFSQFTSMLDILQDYCAMRGYHIRRLDGSTGRVHRAIAMAEYQKPNSKFFIFLMTTRAGGLGITLTAADTVVLYDSDWNPQVDLQAMDRVHRIGQSKPVTVYRLVCGGTVEERIVQRAQKKMYLDSMVSRGSTAQAANMDKLGKGEVLSLIRMGAGAAVGSTGGCESVSDEELEVLMDRSEEAREKRANDKRVSEPSTERREGVEGGQEDEAVAFDPNSEMFSIRAFEGVQYGSKTKPPTMKQIAEMARQEGLIEKPKEIRAKTSRFEQIDGYTVLALNNYELGSTLTVAERELKGKPMDNSDLTVGGRKKSQRAGVDYPHEDTCLNCWDGGNLLCCDGCPASYHPACLGFTEKEVEKLSFRWYCPHHSCTTCSRSTAEAGGLLFRCLVCPAAFCEDHLPPDIEYKGECNRFKRLGQRPNPQGYYIYCSPKCSRFGKTQVEAWSGVTEDSDEEVEVAEPDTCSPGGGQKGYDNWGGEKLPARAKQRESYSEQKRAKERQAAFSTAINSSGSGAGGAAAGRPRSTKRSLAAAEGPIALPDLPQAKRRAELQSGSTGKRNNTPLDKEAWVIDLTDSPPSPSRALLCRLT